MTIKTTLQKLKERIMETTQEFRTSIEAEIAQIHAQNNVKNADAVTQQVVDAVSAKVDALKSDLDTVKGNESNDADGIQNLQQVIHEIANQLNAGNVVGATNSAVAASNAINNGTVGTTAATIDPVTGKATTDTLVSNAGTGAAQDTVVGGNAGLHTGIANAGGNLATDSLGDTVAGTVNNDVVGEGVTH